MQLDRSRLSPQHRTLIRRVIISLCLLVSVLALADTARILYFPPSQTVVSVFDTVRIELTVERKFIRSFDDCVGVQWEVVNDHGVFFNGVTAPSAGARDYCVSPEMPIPATDIPLDDWNADKPMSAYVGVAQYPDVVVMARVYDGVDSFHYATTPIYVLGADFIWLWRVAVAVAGILAAAYIGGVGFVRTGSAALGAFAIRNRVALGLGGLTIAVLIIIVTQTVVVVAVFSILAEEIGRGSLRALMFNAASIARTVGVLVLFGVAGLALGYRVMRMIDPALTDGDPVAVVASALVLGDGLLSLALVLLGLLGQINSISVVGLMLVALAGGVGQGRSIVTRIRASVAGVARVIRSETATWRGMVVVSLLLMLLPALNVIVNVNWDAHTTYMTQAKIIAATGGVWEPARGDDIHFVASGMVGEARMGAAYLLGGMAAAKMHTYLLYLAQVGAGIALARGLGLSRRGQVLALVALVSSSLLFGMVGWGKVDGYGFAPALLSIYFGVRLMSAGRRSDALVCGLFAGIAIVAKLTYLPTLGVLLPMLTLLSVPRRDLLRVWLWVLAGVLLPLSVFALRTLLVIDNPLAMAQFYFSGTSPGRFQILTENPGERLRRMLYFYFPLSWFGGFSGPTLVTLTPLWLVLLPVLVWKALRAELPRQQTLLLGTTVVSYIVWMFVFSNPIPLRYQAGVLVVFLVIGAGAYADLIAGASHAVIRAGLVFTVYLALLTGVSFALVLPVNALRFIQEDCETHSIALCEGIALVNAEAPPDTHLLTNMPLYTALRSDLILGRGGMQDHLALLSLSPSARWMYLYDNGFEYVLDWNVSGYWLMAGRQRLQLYPVVPLDPDAAPASLEVETLMENSETRVYTIQPATGGRTE